MVYVLITMFILLIYLSTVAFFYVKKAKDISIPEYENRCVNKNNYEIMDQYKETISHNKVGNINDLHKKTLELISRV